MYDNKNISNINSLELSTVCCLKNAVFPDEGPIRKPTANSDIPISDEHIKQKETAETRRSPVQFKEVYL